MDINSHALSLSRNDQENDLENVCDELIAEKTER